MKFLKQILIYLSLLFFVITSQSFADELYLYAGAGLRKPTDRIISQFEKNTGHKIIVNYDGSGKLLSRYLAIRQGDLFMPGAFFYIEKLAEKDLVISDQNVVYHTPVIAVHRKGRHKIDSFEDLAKPGLRIALGDPKSMAFGRTSMEILETSGMKEDVLRNVVVYGATVNQLTLYVIKRTVDASIIGRANAFVHSDTLQMIEIPAEYFNPEIIAIAVLKTSTKQDLAKQFQHFVVSPSGIDQFKKAGFLPIEQ